MQPVTPHAHAVTNTHTSAKTHPDTRNLRQPKRTHTALGKSRMSAHTETDSEAIHETHKAQSTWENQSC